MFITMQITLDEEGFAQLEDTVREMRAWLDAGPDSRDGRGDYFFTNISSTDGHSVFLAVRRSEGA